MGLFDWFRKKRCACCGKKLADEEELFKEALALKSDPFLRAKLSTNFSYSLGVTAKFLSGRAFICRKCSAGVCLMCKDMKKEGKIRWENFPQCPKCGSDMEDLMPEK